MQPKAQKTQWAEAQTPPGGQAAAPRAENRLAGLLAVTAALGAARTPEAVAEAVIALAGKVLGTPSGALFVLDGQGTALELVSAYQVSPEALARYARVPLSSPIPITVAARTGQPLVFGTHADLAAHFPVAVNGRDPQNQASATIPLLLGERVQGVLSLAWREAHTFNADDEHFLLTVSRQAALALENLRLHKTNQRLQSALDEGVQVRRTELDDSEARFQLLINSVRDYAIFMLDPHGHVASWNTGAVRIKGYTADEIIGQHFSRFYLPEDKQRGLPAHGLSQALREGRYEFEGWRLRKDGTRFWADVIITPVYGEGGQLAGFAKVTRDLTERRRTEEALRETAQRLADAEQVAHLGSWHWDVPANVVTWSDELYRVYGVQPGTPVTYEAYLGFVHPADRDAVHAAINRALTTHRPFAFDHRIIRADGSVRTMQSAGQPVLDDEGRVVALSGAGQDITERKRLEEELHRSREQLRQLSARLESAREEERARIAREIHDELGGMLTGLKMDVAQMRRNAAELAPATRTKLDEFSAAIDLTVKDVRRIASELRPAVLDDFGLLAALEWQLNDFQRRSGLACTWTGTTDRLELPAEANTAVFRVFQECLTNIARHAEASRVDVRVAVQGGDLSLQVSDDGRGITPEQSLGLKSLGLVGMRERVTVLGGTVEIQRRPEGGTTVLVRLPLGPSRE